MRKTKKTSQSPTRGHPEYSNYNVVIKNDLQNRVRKITQILGIKIYAAIEQALILWVDTKKTELNLTDTDLEQDEQDDQD